MRPNRTLARGACPPLTPKKKRQKGMRKQQPKAAKSGSENRQRSGQIAFRVTHEERAQIEAAADAEELTIGSFVRGKILKKIVTKETRRPSLDREILGRALGMLGKVGSNINQIAKHMNSGGHTPAAEILKALNDFAILKEQILKAIGGLCDSQGQVKASSGRAGALPDEAGKK